MKPTNEIPTEDLEPGHFSELTFQGFPIVIDDELPQAQDGFCLTIPKGQMTEGQTNLIRFLKASGIPLLTEEELNDRNDR